ncbi:protein TBATA isoform X2 [Patella vulgata]|nr:protein TBATA isoform X2 [Patella vulgata]
MSLSEVFRPNTGPAGLVVRDNISNGVPVASDSFLRQRPATQGGNRFGQLSRSQFFTRHNPHPSRVRHFKGLLDVPICSVNDDGIFASPKYSLPFPPNNYNSTKISKWNGRIPVNSLNVDSQRHSTNTVAGLNYFTGLNSYPFREKAVPKVGLVPVTESWRDQLKMFTDQLNGDDNVVGVKREEDRPRTTMYSRDTGRIIPPPSRAMSRHASRRGQRTPFAGGFQHISSDPDIENMVLTMLCQILQTEDTNAVQAWLCSAGEREKAIVMDLIKAAMVGKEEYYGQQQPVQIFEEDPAKSFLPPINEGNGLINGDARLAGTQSKIDRLIVENGDENQKWSPSKLQRADDILEMPAGIHPPLASKPIVTDTDDNNGVQPPSTEVFRPATQGPQCQFQPLEAQLPTGDMMNTNSTSQPTGTWNPFNSVSQNTF